jgi:hypothetical protein
MKWLKCDSFPEYEISENGDIRRICNSIGNNGGHVWKAGRIKKQTLDSNGYLYVKMNCNKSARVHRLVAMAFLPAPESLLLDVAHNDGCRTNNHYTNLRWATRKDNMSDTLMHGTRAVGEKHGNAKLKDQDILLIKQIWSKGGVTQQMLGERFSVSRSYIGAIIAGKYRCN